MGARTGIEAWDLVTLMCLHFSNCIFREEKVLWWPSILAHITSSWQKGGGMDPNQCKNHSHSCCSWWPSTPLPRGCGKWGRSQMNSHCMDNRAVAPQILVFLGHTKFATDPIWDADLLNEMFSEIGRVDNCSIHGGGYLRLGLYNLLHKYRDARHCRSLALDLLVLTSYK